MTKLEHDELVKQEAAGKLLIGVDRAFARKFYTEFPLKEIRKRTGEAPYFEKGVTFLCWSGSPSALLTTLVMSPFLLGWWSLLTIPLSILVWVGFSTNSSRGSAGLSFPTLILGSSIGSWSTGLLAWRFSLVLFSLAIAVWLGRLLYVATTVFLRGFALRNHLAFELVQDGITIVDC